MNPEKKAAKAVAKLTDHETVVWNALMLASSGAYVFPVLLTDPRPKPNGHVKATKRYPVKWGTEASVDPDAVADMFERNPTAAVGIATGPSRLIAIDLDQSEEKDGRASLGDANLSLGMMKGWTYPTLGGGRHFIFRSPEGRYAKTLSDLPYEGEPLLGVDIRATGGMLVYYGPRIEKKIDLAALPEAPDWAIIDAAPTGSKTAPDLAMSAWLKSLRKGPMGPRVEEAMRSVKKRGMGHGELLVATNRLAELGASGATGVREAVEKARERYLGEFPEYAKAWDDAMLDAAQYYGEPPTILAIPKPLMPPAEVVELTPREVIQIEAALAASGKPSKALAKVAKEAKRADVVKAPKTPKAIEPKRKKLPYATPDDFIEPRTGLNSERLGEYVNEDGRVGLGLDEAFWVYEHGVWTRKDTVVRDRVVRLLGPRYRRDHVGIARDTLAAKAETERITGEPHPDLINVKNGMLDWRTGKLLPHSPVYRSTVQLAVTYTPGAPHPLFDKWLALVVGDDPDMGLSLWEVIAYSVYNGNPFQKAAMLHGVANGGKSTYIRLIECIVGAGNVVNLTPEQMEEKFLKASLMGKLLNTQGEYEGKRVITTNSFKSIVGGDQINAEWKGRDSFNFRPWAFHIFAGNEFDLTSDTTEGYYRRWFPLVFSTAVRDLIDWTEADFYAEADAVFSEAVTHLPRIIDEQRAFTETLHTMNAQALMRAESDTTAIWLDDDAHLIEHDPSNRQAWVNRTHLYSVYKNWTEQSGHRPMSNRVLYKRLDRIGYETRKVRGLYRIYGIMVDTLPMTIGAEPVTGGEDDAQA